MINFGFIDLREISYKKFNIMSFVDLAIEGVLKHSRSYKPGETGFHRSEDDLAREIENIFHRAGEDRQGLSKMHQL